MLVDWQRVTNTLRVNYGSLAAASRVIGIDRELLRRLNRGILEQPKFDTGVVILRKLYEIDAAEYRKIHSDLKLTEEK